MVPEEGFASGRAQSVLAYSTPQAIGLSGALGRDMPLAYPFEPLYLPIKQPTLQVGNSDFVPILVPEEGFEPPTFASEARRSDPLSYSGIA